MEETKHQKRLNTGSMAAIILLAIVDLLPGIFWFPDFSPLQFIIWVSAFVIAATAFLWFKRNKVLLRLDRGNLTGRNILNKIFPSIFIVLIILLVLNVIKFANKDTELNSKRIFSESDKRFKVLILPFHQVSTVNGKRVDVGYVVKERLETLNKQDSLNLAIYYLSDFSGTASLDEGKIESMIRFHHADHIVYGYYSLNDCESGNDKICVKYATDTSRWNFAKKFDFNFQETNFVGLETLKDGSALEEIDETVYRPAILACWEKQDFNRMLKLFHALNNYDNNPDHLLVMGYCYYKTGALDEAEKMYRQAIKLDSNNFVIWSKLANNYSSKNDFKNAGACLQKTLRLKPDYDIAWANLGYNYAKQGREKASRACYKRANMLDPKNSMTLYGLGLAYSRVQIYDSAIMCYKRMLKINAGRYEAYESLGIVYAELQEWSKAEVKFLRAIEMKPDNTWNLVKLSKVYTALKERGKAKVFAKKALGTDSTSSYALYNMGKVYQEESNLKEAILFYKRAIQWQPAHKEALVDLGFCYINLFRYYDAVSVLEKAYSVDPNDAFISYNLAVAKSLIREKDEALFYLMKAIDLRLEFMAQAQADHAFDWMRGDNKFRAVIGADIMSMGGH